jgi:subtilisin family serine protease
MKAKVIAKLNKRLWPSTKNTPLPNPLIPNDIIEILEEVEGEAITPTNNTWYKTDKGFYVWSGGVSLFNNYNERVIQVPLEYRRTRGTGVKVAILDSGIFREHQSLIATIKGVHNSSGSSAGVTDKLRHGTHCAGIIGARNEKNAGNFISGVAPDSALFISKVATDKGNFFAENVIKGLEWAIQEHVNIVNMSFALNSYNEELSALMGKAHEEGIILIVSAKMKYCHHVRRMDIFRPVTPTASLSERWMLNF